jgi:threonine dehydrogenase-like Zn-dependent dehydrogenase
MKAIVCDGFGESAIRDVPKPTAGPDELLLEIERVQLSVTECNLYRGNEIAHYETVRNRLDGGDARLFGHEFCGTVRAVGDDTTGFEEGDRVYAPGKIPCHECRQCRTGFELHCPSKTYIGYDTPGALAEYAALPAEALCRVPDGVSDAEAAAMQPLASALLCVEEANIQSGDIVAVFGTGVMGYQCAQLARLEGAERVLAIDIDDRKLDIADDRGLTAIDAAETDPVSRITEETGGIGVDVAFEAVGGRQTTATGGTDPIAQAFDAVRSGGSVVQVGYIIGDISVTPRQLRSKSVNWINPVTGATALTPNTTTGEYVASLVADGRLSIDEYVTHELQGLESFEEAIEITMDKESYGALGPVQMVV